MTGDFDDTWDMKLAKSYLEFLCDHADNEEEERRMLGDYWFEITIDSIEPAAPEVTESDKPADTQSP